MGKIDRDEAGEAYRVQLVDWDAKIATWRQLLRDGPQALSLKQRHAVAADYARSHLARHEDEPFDAPAPRPIPVPTDNGFAAWKAITDGMSPEEQTALAGDFRKLIGAGDTRRPKLIFQLLEKYPALAAAVGADLGTILEEMHGGDTDAALANHGLQVDRVTRILLNLELASYLGAAERGLEARRAGDYRPVPDLVNAPEYVASVPKPVTGGGGGVLTLEFLLDHKANTTSIRPKTVADNRSYLRKFAKFVGHDDARRVTRDDVRRWRDELATTGLSPKTITDKYLSALRAALSHGVKEFDLPSNVASEIADNRATAAPTRSKGWTEEEAVTILSATFRGSSKALSEPHRRAIRWLPWLMAYTGLRAAEAAQLQGRNVKEEDGVAYLLITPADGSTKSGKAWMVGVHKHLLDMGFIDFVRGVGAGPLFYEPYPAGTDLTMLRGKSRALEAAGRVASWIRDEVGLNGPLGRPLHAFRHLFTTRSRLCGMNKEARDFMMGSRSTTDAREGYGEWPPSVLHSEINKLSRLMESH